MLEANMTSFWIGLFLVAMWQASVLANYLEDLKNTKRRNF